MTAPETRFLHRVLAAHGARPDLRLFRNETAGAWVGEVVGREGGTVVLARARPILAGLCVGSSDLIGFTDAGRFVALELKVGKGRATKAQQQFIKVVRDFGGIAGVARNMDEVEALIGRRP